MAELVDPAARDGLHRARDRRRSLGHDDDREVAPALVTAADQPADLVDVERLLGDEDDVGPARQPRVQGDPAGVPSHHLDDQVAVVRLRRRVQAIDRVAGDLHRGVEPEGLVGAADVVVDRLRDAEDRQLVVGVQADRGAERVLAADGYEPVELERLHVPGNPLRTVVAPERVGPRRPEDRAAPGQDPPRRLERELLHDVLQRAAPTVAEP